MYGRFLPIVRRGSTGMSSAHPLGIVDCPLHWDGSQPFQVVRLSPDDSTYQHIEQSLNHGPIGGGGGDQKEYFGEYDTLEVVSIDRVENVAQWNLYVAKRNAMFTQRNRHE
eukprot:PhF_6_TR19951/c1_g2_i2/m.29051